MCCFNIEIINNDKVLIYCRSKKIFKSTVYEINGWYVIMWKMFEIQFVDKIFYENIFIICFVIKGNFNFGNQLIKGFGRWNAM
jgi:hypothetical protein